MSLGSYGDDGRFESDFGGGVRGGPGFVRVRIGVHKGHDPSNGVDGLQGFVRVLGEGRLVRSVVAAHEGGEDGEVLFDLRALLSACRLMFAVANAADEGFLTGVAHSYFSSFANV